MKSSVATLMIVLVMSALMLSSCLLPGMIPLNPEPTGPAEASESTESGSATQAPAEPSGSLPELETDSDVVLESLQAGAGISLAALAQEQYSDEDTARPGTLTYTVEITDDRPTYFSYGWCTTTEEILLQNFEHIKVGFYLNGKGLGSDVVHTFSSQGQVDDTEMVCLNFVTLLSNWPDGEYQLTSVVIFDEEINDGVADFEAGEYIHEYKVTVKK